MRRFKFLQLRDGKLVSNNGDAGEWKVGEWKRVDGELNLCKNGLHCSRLVQDALNYVKGDVLAEVEVRGNHISDDDKECWREMRVVGTWGWGKRESMMLGVISALACLKNYEKKYPDDDRPRKAIEAAQTVIENNTQKTRSAASAAWSAARSAAWSAAKRKIHVKMLRVLESRGEVA